jgi:hypothetical protein
VDGSDLLLTSAEVAVTFAGFASLVSIFGGRTSRDGAHIDRNRLRTMLVCSLAVAALCFVPFVPQQYGLAEATSWRLSSVALLAAILGLVARVARDYRAVREAGIRLSLGIRILNSGLLLGPLLLAIANVAGWSGTYTSGHYLVCLLALLALAGVQFARMIDSLVFGASSP